MIIPEFLFSISICIFLIVYLVILFLPYPTLQFVRAFRIFGKVLHNLWVSHDFLFLFIFQISLINLFHLRIIAMSFYRTISLDIFNYPIVLKPLLIRVIKFRLIRKFWMIPINRNRWNSQMKSHILLNSGLQIPFLRISS